MKTTPHGWTILDAEAAVLSFSYNFSKTGQSNCITAKLPSGDLPRRRERLSQGLPRAFRIAPVSPRLPLPT